MDRNTRRVKEGVVVSKNSEKTAIVRVEKVFSHPKYKKTIKTSKKFFAHDEANVSKIGDIVEIIETRPISKLKFHRIAKVVGHMKLKLRDLPKKSEKQLKNEKKREMEKLSDTPAN